MTEEEVMGDFLMGTHKIAIKHRIFLFFFAAKCSVVLCSDYNDVLSGDLNITCYYHAKLFNVV